MVRWFILVMVITLVMLARFVIWPSDKAQALQANEVVESSKRTASIVAQPPSSITQVEVIEEPIESIRDLPLLPVDQIVTAIGCKYVPRTIQAQTERLNQALADDDLPEMIESMQRRFERCADAAAFDVTMIEQLVLHAKQGSRAAVLKLWRLDHKIRNEYWSYETTTRDEFVVKKHQFDQLKYKLTEYQAQQGSDRAMLELVKGYYNEDPFMAVVGGQNYIKSLAYSELVLHLSKDDKLYSQAQWFNRVLRSKMTDDEIQESMVLFDVILSKQS